MPDLDRQLIFMKRVLYKLVFVFTLLYLLLDGITGGYYHEYALQQSYTGTFAQHVEQDNSVLEDAAETQDTQVLGRSRQNRIKHRSETGTFFIYPSFPGPSTIISIAYYSIRGAQRPSYYTFLFRFCPF